MKKWIETFRIRHWVKNILVFAAPFFGGRIGESRYLLLSLIAFLAFSFAASFTYIVNDLVDRKRDRLHPRKRKRPIASGEVGTNSAILLSGLFLVASILLSLTLSFAFLLFVVSYIILNLLYSALLKNYPLFDIFAISLGFILRVYGGGAATAIHISSWLFSTVFLLALLFSTGKRLAEERALGKDALNHRKTLGNYPEGFLRGVLWAMLAASLVTYALYTVEKGFSLFLTVPVAAFGLMRYAYLVESQREGDPTEALLGDPLLLITSLFWVLFSYFLAYGGKT